MDEYCGLLEAAAWYAYWRQQRADLGKEAGSLPNARHLIFHVLVCQWISLCAIECSFCLGDVPVYAITRLLVNECGHPSNSYRPLQSGQHRTGWRWMTFWKPLKNQSLIWVCGG